MNTAVHTRRWAWGLMWLGLCCVGMGTMAGSEGWQAWWLIDDALIELNEIFVVVATQGRRDLQGLKAALALQPQGLWFVASARKAAVLLDTLVTSGEDPAAVARIVAPAGEFIGAQTPEEIALSVLTSVVAARRGRESSAPAAQAALTATMAASALTSSVAAASAGSSSCCSTTAATEPKEAVKSKAFAPVAASACCAGSKQAAGQAAATATDAVPSRTVEPALALAAVPASVKSSCCGG